MEYDSPYILMQKPDGMFRGMCERSGEFNELMEIAKEKYERDRNESKEESEKLINIEVDENENLKKYDL
jgi:hypothetical protein